jgi:hypothetical protein
MVLAKYKNESIFSSDLKKVLLTPYQPVQYIPTWRLVGFAMARNLHHVPFCVGHKSINPLPLQAAYFHMQKCPQMFHCCQYVPPIILPFRSRTTKSPRLYRDCVVMKIIL